MLVIHPKKRIAPVWLGYTISLCVAALVILGVVFLFQKRFVSILILCLAYLVLWLLSLNFSWFIKEELSEQDGKLVFVDTSIIDGLGHGKTTYRIDRVEKVSYKKHYAKLKVSGSTVQEHPFKPKACKKVVIYDYNNSVKELISKYMEVSK